MHLRQWKSWRKSKEISDGLGSGRDNNNNGGTILHETMAKVYTTLFLSKALVNINREPNKYTAGQNLKTRGNITNICILKIPIATKSREGKGWDASYDHNPVLLGGTTPQRAQAINLQRTLCVRTWTMFSLSQDR